MIKTPLETLNRIKNNQLFPIYFLHGEESYFIDKISDYIENHILTEEEKTFNQVIFYGKESNIIEILNQARRYPMMSEKQVIIVKEAQFLEDLYKENNVNVLTSYLKNPTKSTILVFCHKNKSIDKRKKMGKIINQYTNCVESKRIYDEKIPTWVKQIVAEQQFSITPKAVQMICERVGNNLDNISNEINKITINLKRTTLIDEDVVQKYIGISKDYNVFELQNALAIKDNIKISKILHYFEFNKKNNPLILMLSNLYGFYSKLLTIVSNHYTTPREIADVLKINPFFAKTYLLASEKYSLQQTINAISYIKNADLQLKGISCSGNVTELQILKELVFKLTH